MSWDIRKLGGTLDSDGRLIVSRNFTFPSSSSQLPLYRANNSIGRAQL